MLKGIFDVKLGRHIVSLLVRIIISTTFCVTQSLFVTNRLHDSSSNLISTAARRDVDIHVSNATHSTYTPLTSIIDDCGKATWRLMVSRNRMHFASVYRPLNYYRHDNVITIFIDTLTEI